MSVRQKKNLEHSYYSPDIRSSFQFMMVVVTPWNSLWKNNKKEKEVKSTEITITLWKRLIHLTMSYLLIGTIWWNQIKQKAYGTNEFQIYFRSYTQNTNIFHPQINCFSVRWWMSRVYNYTFHFPLKSLKCEWMCVQYAHFIFIHW